MPTKLSRGRSNMLDEIEGQQGQLALSANAAFLSQNLQSRALPVESSTGVKGGACARPSSELLHLLPAATAAAAESATATKNSMNRGHNGQLKTEGV
jgi:hypothetical protein